jgi:hypothetical protein
MNVLEGMSSPPGIAAPAMTKHAVGTGAAESKKLVSDNAAWPAMAMAAPPGAAADRARMAEWHDRWMELLAVAHATDGGGGAGPLAAVAAPLGLGTCAHPTLGAQPLRRTAIIVGGIGNGEPMLGAFL